MTADDAGRPAPVEKMRIVRGDPATAFRVFTREISRWWPIRGHSVSGDRAVAVVVEERAGGRVFERAQDGTEYDWGNVILWDPPRRFIMTWHPGYPASVAQQVEVSFTEDGADRTRLHLIHRGWEALGPVADDTRQRYVPGWDIVLGRFEEALTCGVR